MFKKEKLKDLHYVIYGELGAGEIAEKTDAILAKHGENVKIPGFRAGHIPMPVLRQRYGEDAAQDAINDLINRDMDSFAKEKKIRPAGAPKASLSKYADGEDAEYTLEFDILPTLPKIDLEKITLVRKLSEVRETDIEKALENIQKNHSDFQKQDENHHLSAGDVAVIDFAGYIGAEKFPGGEGKSHRLTLGSGQFIPGFEDQIIGHKTGDEFDVNVKFPEKYHSMDLAGKDARFLVKIIEALRSVPPAIDDALAKSAGMESIEKLRAHIRDVLEKQNADAAQIEMRNELLDILADKVRLELPESVVEQEMAAARAAADNKNFDEKKERKDAERRVKLGLILAEWGSQNDVKVPREELQSAVWAEAARHPNPHDVYDFYNKNPDALSMLNGMLFERKTLDAMIEKCKIK